MSKSKIKAWVAAMCLHTVPVSAAGVAMAILLGVMHGGNYKILPAVLCMIFAMLAQIASNFANEYFDYVKGTDKVGRAGFKRGVTEGDIAPKSMLWATIGTLAIASLIGLGLLPYGGWWLIGVGVAVAIFALAYSAGPYPLSYNGLGDVAVIIFFGIVPVNMTYYLMVGEFSVDSLLCSIAIGLLASNVLIVNNYRDMEDDMQANKRTTVVIFGRKTMGRAYLISGYAAMVLYIWELPFDLIVTPISAIVYIILHTLTWMKLISQRGAALNQILAATARNMLIFTLTIPLLWLILHLIYLVIS